MGNLEGHLLPGSFFLVFGLWWTWSLWRKYFLTLRAAAEGGGALLSQRRTRYKNSASFPGPTCCRFPIEGVVKIAGTSIGILGELVTGYNDRGVFVNYGNLKHITMYFFFGLNGMMDIFTFHRCNLIPDLDYISAVLATMMEGVLFLYHLDGQNKLEKRLHMLLLYLVFALAISLMLEMRFRNSVIPALCRVYLTLLQGTWFWQIGFTLYVLKWSPDNMKQMKAVPLLFCCHFGVVFVFLLITGHIIRCTVNRNISDKNLQRQMYAKHSTEDGGLKISNGEDSDSEGL